MLQTYTTKTRQANGQTFHDVYDIKGNLVVAAMSPRLIKQFFGIDV